MEIETSDVWTSFSASFLAGSLLVFVAGVGLQATKKIDSCLCVNSSKDLWVLVWSDDLLIASASSSANASFKKGVEARLLCKGLGVLGSRWAFSELHW